MFPVDIRDRRVFDWSGAEVGRVVALSMAGPGALFVRLHPTPGFPQAAGGVLTVPLRDVSALRPGEVSLRVRLPELLRASAPRS